MLLKVLENCLIAVINIILLGLFIGAVCFCDYYKNLMDCENYANSMNYRSDFQYNLLSNNVCTFILPSGKRVVSKYYRDMED